MEQLIGGGAPADASSVKNGSTATFMADVIDASREAAVVVDFWAPWCGPCKQLGPVIEKAVRDSRGKVRLVKINVDENQELAAQMRIQSIPAVYAFKDGRPVDGFVGALPESQVKQFVQRLVTAAGAAGAADPVAEALALAKEAAAAGDHARAANIYTQILRARARQRRCARRAHARRRGEKGFRQGEAISRASAERAGRACRDRGGARRARAGRDGRARRRARWAS